MTEDSGVKTEIPSDEEEDAEFFCVKKCLERYANQIGIAGNLNFTGKFDLMSLLNNCGSENKSGKCNSSADKCSSERDAGPSGYSRVSRLTNIIEQLRTNTRLKGLFYLSSLIMHVRLEIHGLLEADVIDSCYRLVLTEKITIVH